MKACTVHIKLAHPSVHTTPRE